MHHETQKDISSLCEEAKADINTLRGEHSGNRGPTQDTHRDGERTERNGEVTL